MASHDLTELIVATEDMILLEHLTEENLMLNLEERFKENIIYVSFGIAKLTALDVHWNNFGVCQPV